MNKSAFTLIELLIVVLIISVLVGMALPYYQDYVRQSRIAKARHELDVIRKGLIKHDTFEENKFRSHDLRLLVGRYLQDLTRDPWDREYEIDYVRGLVFSRGPSPRDEREHIVVHYKPELTLQKATWIDKDNNFAVNEGDWLRLEFSRYLMPVDETINYTNASPPSEISDLWFSPCVDIQYLIATSTSHFATSSELLIQFRASTPNTALAPGSSTVRVSPFNRNLRDTLDREAIGTDNYEPGLEVRIRAR